MLMRRRDAGASAVEYALVLVAVAAVVTLVVFTLGLHVAGLFTTSTACITAEQASTC
jgi:Flp pilus assembly pilin Flp